MPTDIISVPPLNSNLPVSGGVAVWTGPWGNWLTKAQAILFATSQSGTTALRPTKGLWVGRFYWDTTLGKPIWYNGTIWVLADGTAA